MSEIIDVCMQSNISSKIENLPDKYETIVGTKGGQLSGGEKQRVAIGKIFPFDRMTFGFPSFLFSTRVV